MNKNFGCKRLFFISFFLVFLFFILIVQFYNIQIIQGDKWVKQALLQHRLLSKEPFMRGTIFSHNIIDDTYQPIAFDVVKFHFFIDPESIPLKYKKEIAKKLKSFTDKKILKEFYKKSRSRRIIKWLDIEKKEKLLKWWFGYIKGKNISKNAIFFKKVYKRSHPFKRLLGQVLHTVQDEKDENYQGIPTGGVELFFNEHLCGRLGYSKIIRSSRNRFNKKIIRSPRNGKDIYLTIDQYIQAIVEEHLKAGIKKVNAKGGWAVMMDPKTGEILAMAQYPFFNVENYSYYFNDKNRKEHTRLKAVSDAFEPGSIFKPINLAIFLNANRDCRKISKPIIFYPEEKIATSNGIFPGRKKPIKDGRVHKFLNMYMAVQKSSNVYMSELIRRCIDRLGEDYYKSALENIFGFNKKTKIELPAESKGLVPTPGKRHKNGTLEWSSSTPYSLATGHNILVNSIQILKAYAIFANRGIEVQPTIIKKIVEDGKEIIFKKNEKKRVFFKEDIEKIINAMKFTTKIGGTARWGDIMGYTECGKTGTSEKIINGRYSDKYYISSFIGFAPFDDPKFVLMVVIDEPEKKYIKRMGKSWNGGVCAAPIFKEIGEEVLEYLGVAPDDIFGYPYNDPRSDRKKSDWAIEVRNLSMLYKLWNK